MSTGEPVTGDQSSEFGNNSAQALMFMMGLLTGLFLWNALELGSWKQKYQEASVTIKRQGQEY